eukprot:CAMPEP_0113917800 /NCGR_PEP_ID=MMETSP0780_2-20120614/32948_1 /TAXON_ID=652834 /ORGANISM="Palpitomonas bilix" /LENGTH=245 /DNA_ID=CAMNT_0000917439 /DNA_START=53 /DNA_END=788 /DNA_ORIENTATION=- /assembly_acc=CAM_ASM_000599
MVSIRDKLDELKIRGATVPTGCSTVDEMLSGGILTGELLEVVGDSATGKTQLCISAAVYSAYVLRLPVLYIDCSNSFSPTRALQIGEGYSHIGTSKEEDRVWLERIIVHTIFDVDELAESVRNLEAWLDQPDAKWHQCRLIIVDSLASITTPSVSRDHTWGTGRPLSAIAQLKAIAKRMHAAILLTNIYVLADMSIQAAILLTNFLAIGKGATARTPLDPAWSSAVSSRLLLSVQPSGGEPEGEK